jgi:hypothetical protein
MDTSRKSIIDELDTITSNTTGTNVGNSTQGTAEKDIKVITKTMERMVTDIMQLKKENVAIKKEMVAIKAVNQILQDRVEDLAHSVGAGDNLHEWQVDAAQEDAMETAMSNTEIMNKLSDYEQRRIQYGLD